MNPQVTSRDLNEEMTDTQKYLRNENPIGEKIERFFSSFYIPCTPLLTSDAS